MKKVLFIGMTTNYGGVETYILNLFLNIDKTKYECYFPKFNGKVAYYDVLKKEGAQFVELAFSRRNYIKYRKCWMDLLSKYKFDAIYFNTCDIVSIDKLKFAKKKNVPIRIVHAHNSGIQQKVNIFHKISEKISRRNLGKYATCYFACSQSAGDWMFDKHSYQVIHNGIDLLKYKFDVGKRNNVRSRYEINEGKLVGCVGRLSPQKNPLFAEKIAEVVTKLDSDAMFVFVGDGELANQVKDIVKEKNLEDKSIFAGVVDNVNEWMSALDCLVMPSLFEGLPFVLVEAQAAGLPCVVSSTVSKEANITGLLQFIDLDSSEKVWGETILKACRNDRKDYLNQLVAAGYSIENTAKEVCEIIESVESLSDK